MLFLLLGLLLQGVSIGAIKTKANVCSVQFPLDSSRSIAFGSADHRIYYYDLRNTKVPLCTLVGHNRTVSYVKFVDPTNIVSASTDNTLKLWDLSICTSRVIDSPLQSFTGHTNVKVRSLVIQYQASMCCFVASSLCFLDVHWSNVDYFVNFSSSLGLV